MPLALRNLLANKRRLLRSSAGIGFAVLLMLVQLGFERGFFDASLAMVRQIDGDRVICCPGGDKASVVALDKKTGKPSSDIALGVTSRTPEQASPQRVLAINRGHWAIESVHYLIDWNYDEDRSHIRTGFGPANITRLRRFAIGILKSFQKPAQSIAAMMRKPSFRTRLVFDYLRMTKNSVTGARSP